MIKNIVLVYNNDVALTQEIVSLIEFIEVQYKITTITLLDYRVPLQASDETTLTLLYLDDMAIKTFLKHHLSTPLKIGFIPNKESLKTLASYGISKDVHAAIDEAMDEKNMSVVDVLTCNGEIVLTNVVIGDVRGLNYKNIEDRTIFQKLHSFLLNLKHLKFKDYTLTTAKEHSIQTAATGIMVLEHNAKVGKYNVINEELSLHDGQLSAFVISPTSILAHLYYLLRVIFYANLNPNSLPKTLGFIKTSKLGITSTQPMDFMIDGVLMSAKEISLEIIKDSLSISVGKNVIENAQANAQSQEEKEVVKTQYLPKGEMKTLLLTQAVPLFKKASEEDFKELFLALKESAKPSSIYIVLMVLSTLLATTGLFQNSAPVIIGAMILAPLMAPIISLSMGVVRGDSFFISNSLKTLFYGIATALVFSCIFTYSMPLDILTDEMRGRLNPNVLDLMVAIISGIA